MIRAAHSLCLLSLLLLPSLAAEQGPGDEAPLKPVVERVILFAPVAVGALAEDYATAADDYASGMASRVNVLVPGAKANGSDSLPGSGDSAWDEGPVGAASGAHLVVLTTLLEYQVVQSNPGLKVPGEAKAKVKVRGLDVKGKEVWYKTVVVSVPSVENPKTKHIGGVMGRAVWAGCLKGVDALKYWLDQLEPDSLKKRIDRTAGAVPDDVELISVLIDSDPAGADIFVNNVFRGTTPMKVPLPKVKIEVRLQRQGYQVWSNSFTPTADMRVKPGLEPLK